MSKTVYIAGSSNDFNRAEELKKKLEERGIRCKSTWIAKCKARGGGNQKGASLEDQRRWVKEDILGVLESDILWFLLPKEGHTHGAFFEFGLAYGKGKEIYLSGAPEWHSIFLTLAGKNAVEHTWTDDEGLECVCKAACV